jgi:hypothetical protein
MNILKYLLIKSSGIGLIIGTLSGYFYGNRTIRIKYKSKNNCITTIILKNSIPFISGIVCAIIGPSTLILSPLIMIDYSGNLCTCDRIFDNIHSKFLFKYKRYTQLGPNNNIYYAPSHIHINIKHKNIINTF